MLQGIPTASYGDPPASTFSYCLGNPRPVNIVIEIHKFIFPVDFVILDIVEDNKVLIILGRPMLATAHARIDDNNLFLNYEDPRANTPSSNKSPSENWNPVEKFQDSDDNLGIGIDDFVAIDDL
nr:hypothetical protein [Tanacetum cinerariifolium]